MDIEDKEETAPVVSSSSSLSSSSVSTSRGFKSGAIGGEGRVLEGSGGGIQEAEEREVGANVTGGVARPPSRWATFSTSVSTFSLPSAAAADAASLLSLTFSSSVGPFCAAPSSFCVACVSAVHFRDFMHPSAVADVSTFSCGRPCVEGPVVYPFVPVVAGVGPTDDGESTAKAEIGEAKAACWDNNDDDSEEKRGAADGRIGIIHTRQRNSRNKYVANSKNRTSVWL